ncbi:hypothetical protein Slin14017_G060320 [Septoria linicola]|nr:hypothetical protein Slin14017_G060320 [Septoria linicola]
MAPTLEHYFTMRAYFDRPNMLPVGKVKGGPQRTVVPLNTGWLRGNGTNAELLPGSGDWFLLNPETNTGNIDVRISLRTDKGHSIYVHYDGLMKVDAACVADIIGPDYETSDPELKWIESLAWVAEGRWTVEEGEIAIEYEIHRVRPTVKTV